MSWRCFTRCFSMQPRYLSSTLTPKKVHVHTTVSTLPYLTLPYLTLPYLPTLLTNIKNLHKGSLGSNLLLLWLYLKCRNCDLACA